MSEVKNFYELTYIINAALSDDQIKEVIRRVNQYIEEHGGEIVEVDEWGTRRLAYPIQKRRNGYYVNMYFRAPASLIAALERFLEIDEQVLRYLTLRMDAKMLRHYERRKQQAAEAARPRPKDVAVEEEEDVEVAEEEEEEEEEE
ncbi:30S ribosomal protein S6 [Rhodothermus marinus SG0.5JP17-172]|uniref:30S ribosomal protein S6 n=1 Tax=Rhodothermus marinus TaxID=29549 RepID=UPI000223DAC3|nr:30S ribosomal protein S6 [Rhodothermus marinus]AEN72534.1 30S ribosomal protein S6 [Rhodothermus marinus SG0.5JP17-172]